MRGQLSITSTIFYRLKNASNAKTYLLLKDIFPQNAVDLNLLKNGGILYNYFRLNYKMIIIIKHPSILIKGHER